MPTVETPLVPAEAVLAVAVETVVLAARVAAAASNVTAVVVASLLVAVEGTWPLRAAASPRLLKPLHFSAPVVLDGPALQPRR